MAVAIRLRRAGAKKKAFYHLVVMDSRHSCKGKFLEKLGHYDPKKSPPVFNVNRDRINYWLGVGAQTSRTVAQLIAKLAPESTETQGNKNVNS